MALNYLSVCVRFGFPPTWRDTAGSTACHSTFYCADAFYYTYCAPFYRSNMDSQHSRLHQCQHMAYNGCRLPHHSPYYIPSQLWPLQYMDGLDVRNSSGPHWWWRIQEGEVMHFCCINCIFNPLDIPWFPSVITWIWFRCMVFTCKNYAR